ncbi:hypothetical protein GN956_G18885 [Arapaima gigas]
MNRLSEPGYHKHFSLVVDVVEKVCSIELGSPGGPKQRGRGLLTTELPGLHLSPVSPVHVVLNLSLSSPMGLELPTSSWTPHTMNSTFSTMGYLDHDFDYEDIEFLCEMNDTRQMQLDIQVYVHSFICLFGLLGNLLVIVTYIFYKRAKSMSDVYLLNVAIADVLFVLSLPIMIYNEQHNWSMGNWACKLFRGMYSINLYSGMLLLTCISSNRYVAIVRARRSFRMRSQTLIYSRIVCCAVWVFSVVLSIPSLVYNTRYEDTHLGEKSEAVCYLKFEDNNVAQLMKVLLPVTQVTVGFFIPLLVMCFCYTSIIITLLRAKNFQKHKAVRVVFAVVVVFIACHMPYNVTLLYHTVELFKTRDCTSEQTVAKVLMVTESLAYVHCCLNPVLYAFIGVKFRNHFLKVLGDLWCLGKRYIYWRSSRATSEVYVSTRKSLDGSNNENGSSFTM